MNVIFVMIDSLRPDHLGINGNNRVKTPNIDDFGSQSVRFTKAYPESLPTIPVRKAMLTGKRYFPFKDWQLWRPVPVPGWWPLTKDEYTIAELLNKNGYRTAFITDVYHSFKPGMNLHLGFDEWRWIRGNEWDFFRSGSQQEVDVTKYITPKMDPNSRRVQLSAYYLRSAQLRQNEEDYCSPQVFRSAARWIEENAGCGDFFLYVDCFDPHEPWLPPRYYEEMYDPGYDGTRVLVPEYGSRDYLSDAELNNMRARYAGEVTMVDKWFGYFMEKVKSHSLLDNTIVILASDHGTLLGEHNLIGKPQNALYPELMDLVFYIKVPGQEPKVIDSLVYNHYFFETVMSLLGEEVHEQSQGKNLWDLVEGKTEKHLDYVTSIMKDWCFARTDRYWYIGGIKGEEPHLYDLEADPQLNTNIAEESPEVVNEMKNYLLEDAGGELPDLLPPSGKWLF